MSGTAGRPVRTQVEQRLGRWLLRLALPAILVLTLTPLPRQSRQGQLTPVTCLVCGELGGVDVTLNLLLFLPLGLALGLRGVRVRRAAALAFLATLTIETLQYFVITGRDASVSDVLTNTLGATLGALLAWHWRALAFPSSGTARRLGAGAALLWVASQAAAAWGLQPVLPPAPWWGQWAPHYRPYTAFPGQVLDVRVGDVPVARNDVIVREAELREALLRGDALEVRAVTAGAKLGFSPLVRVVGGWAEPRAEVLLLSQHEAEIVFHARTRIQDLRLRGPTVTTGDVLAASRGDSLHVTARATRRGAAVVVDVGAARTVREIHWSPSMAWSFVVPFGFALDSGGLARLDALWLAGCLILPAYWARRGWRARDGRGWRAPALLLGALVTGLAVVPLAFGLAPVSPLEWLGGLTGLALGALGARQATRVAAVTRARHGLNDGTVVPSLVRGA